MELSDYRAVDLPGLAERWELWWNGKLGRPIFQAVSLGRTPESRDPAPFIPVLRKKFRDDEIVGRFQKCLDGQRFFGDGFPLLWLNFGPGVLAAMLGGSSESSDDTVWFGPGAFAGRELEEFSLRSDPENSAAAELVRWYRRLGEVFGPQIQLGMTDLGGALDVLASLRGAETLMMDLFDAPETVQRLLLEESAAWKSAFLALERVIHEFTPGSSCWAGSFSRRRNYIIQSDFSYMISPDMFREFVAPRLAEQAEFLDYVFYHMDGPGEIPHLDQILRIPNLRGVQWVPGAGRPEQDGWPEIIDAIDAAGLKLHLSGSIRSMRTILRRLKHPENAQVNLYVPVEQEAEAIRFVEEFS